MWGALSSMCLHRGSAGQRVSTEALGTRTRCERAALRHGGDFLPTSALILPCSLGGLRLAPVR